MQSMNISLPDQLKDFVGDQVGSGRYSSVSEYVRKLIRDDEKRKGATETRSASHGRYSKRLAKLK
jgi:antitoxin ParD1/3/4